MKTITIDARKVALLADLHWGKSRDSNIKLQVMDEFIDWFIEEMRKREVKHIIFLGDWFHSRNLISVKTSNRADDAMRRLTADGVQIYMIVGNHDAYFKDTNEINSIKHYQEMPGVHPIESLTAVHFIPSDKTGLLCPWDAYVPQDEKYDAMFGHFEFRGAYLTGTVSTDGINVEELFETSPNVFGGHYHIRAEYPHKTGKVITIGSPVELDWGDCENSKGVYFLNTADMTTEFIENVVSPKHIRVYWSKIKAKTEDLNKIKGNFAKFVIDTGYKFEHIMQVLNIINTAGPLKPCEADFVFNQSLNMLDKVQLVDDDEVLTMSKLEYMIKYTEEFFKNNPDEVKDVSLQKMKALIKQYWEDSAE